MAAPTRHAPDLPPIVFGSATLGNLFAAYPDEQKLAIARAWIQSVPKPVHIDTAGKYGAGLALECIGRNLRELGVAADEVVISNKLGWVRKPLEGDEPLFERGIWHGLQHDAEQQISYDGILRCWEEGNELLGEPYAARLLSVHDPDEYLAAAADEDDRFRRWDDIQGAYRALAELRDRGEADAVGVGAKDWRTIVEVDKRVDLDWVMIANSLTLYSHPTELLAFVDSLRERGVPAINSAVFHSGFLVGGDFFDYHKQSPSNPEDLERLAWRERFFKVCRTHGVEPAAACMHFAVSPPGVVALAISSSRPERIASDVAVMRSPPPQAFWEELKTRRLIDPTSSPV
ncbi:aldo/keto reductase [Botrimarina sp.]|uniref:aldo/keto reductase n=1 Tax=Botrimarina sp. TaxID=2795802 RepID=UPI0032EDD06A